MTRLKGCAALLVVLATGAGCDGGMRPTADCTSWPDSTVLATSPASGTALAPGQSVEVSARFQFAGCRTAGVTMYALDQASRNIAVRGTTSAQVPVGVTVQTIVGTLNVPQGDVSAVSVRYVMILDARSGPRELARLDYPVR